MKSKNPFFLFLTACVPGCGQMYLGYMARGISLTASFFALIAVVAFLHLGELALFMPVLWLYAFFDTYNLRARLESGDASPDAWLYGLDGSGAERFGELLGKHGSFVGWVLVVIGVYSLWQTFMNEVLGGIIGDTWLYSFMLFDLPRLAGIAALILLGIWFIRGPKARSDEDFRSFTPPTRDPRPNAAASTASSPENAAGTASAAGKPDGAPMDQTVSDAVELILDSTEQEARHDGE